MAIRTPTPLSVRRQIRMARDIAGKASADGAAETLESLAGILGRIEAALKARDQKFGHDLSRVLAKFVSGLDDRFEKSYDAGRQEASGNRWLKDLAVTMPEGSKWSDAYVRRLGALEHCDEVLALHRAEAVAKAEGRKGAVEPALERELADLWCILEMCRMADEGFAETCDDRAARFRP